MRLAPFSTALSAIVALGLLAGPTVPAASAAVPDPCGPQRTALTNVNRAVEAHNNAPHEFGPEQRAAYNAYNEEARRLNSASTQAAAELRRCEEAPVVVAPPRPPTTTPTREPGNYGPIGQMGERGEKTFRERSGATDLNEAWTRPGEKPRKNFPGLDASSTTELTQVKVLRPGNERAYLRFLTDLRNDPSSTSLSRQAVTAIGEASARMKERGLDLPLPPGYQADPLGYIRERTVFRAPDDQVAGIRVLFVVDAMAHPETYGYPRTLTAPQAWRYATERFQGIGATFGQLSQP